MQVIDLSSDGPSQSPPPCVVRTWCVLGHGHSGACVEVPRGAHERPDWDRKTPDPRGWRKR